MSTLSGATCICLVASGVAALAGMSGSDDVLAVEGFAILITAILFLIWFHAAFVVASNATPDSFEGLRSWWAVLCWFVPLLNFVFPFVIARRIWKTFAQAAGQPTEPPGFFVIWWGCWVFSTILTRFEPRVAPAFLAAAGVFGAGVVSATTRLAAKRTESLIPTTSPGAVTP